MFMERPYLYEIEPTNHCPYRCIMCPNGLGWMTRSKGFMELRIFKRALTALSPEQRLLRLHHFGEAVLHPEITSMIQMVTDKGLVPLISLNPFTLNNDLIEMLADADPCIVCFSMDGFTARAVKEIRGIKMPVEHGIEMIRRFCQVTRSKGCKTLKVLQTVMLDRNRTELEARDKLASALGGSDFCIYDAPNTGFGFDSIIRKHSASCHDPALVSREDCQAPFNQVVVLWDGGVAICCYDYNGDTVIGNISSETLETIWNGDKARQLRKLFLSGHARKNPRCRTCFKAPQRPVTQSEILSVKNTQAFEEERVILNMYERSFGKIVS